MDSKRIFLAVVTIVVLAILVVFLVVVVGRDNTPSASTNAAKLANAASGQGSAAAAATLSNGEGMCLGVAAGTYAPVSYPMYSPEPWASITDLITAGEYVEKAIHGTTKDEVQFNLAEARTQLCHAQKYFDAAYNASVKAMDEVGTVEYKKQASYLQYAVVKLDGIAAGVPDTGAADFDSYLSDTIYYYMGDLGSLYRSMMELLNMQQPQPGPQPGPQPVMGEATAFLRRVGGSPHGSPRGSPHGSPHGSPRARRHSSGHHGLTVHEVNHH